MLTIKNLDSTKTKKIKYKKQKILALSGVLAEVIRKVPVYLVNPDTMDKLYPPEKRLLLDEECIKEIFSSERWHEGEDEDLLERCLRKSRKMIAVGLYMREVPDEFGELDEPAVFICPERCISWGDKTGVPHEFVFTKVLFHEFAHAYLDVERIKTNCPLSRVCARLP